MLCDNPKTIQHVAGVFRLKQAACITLVLPPRPSSHPVALNTRNRYDHQCKKYYVCIKYFEFIYFYKHIYQNYNIKLAYLYRTKKKEEKKNLLSTHPPPLPIPQKKKSLANDFVT